ncbi:MAG: flagellar biosynthesis protein FlhF [Pirellulales bacterium]|nr:flagellar biosynthesis protein FlhF [Pirellulales bacterium]
MTAARDLRKSDIRTFQAGSLREALEYVRQEFGPAAQIVRTREIPAGGLWNRLAGRTQIEISAQAAQLAEEAVVYEPAAAPLDLGLDLQDPRWQLAQRFAPATSDGPAPPSLPPVPTRQTSTPTAQSGSTRAEQARASWAWPAEASLLYAELVAAEVDPTAAHQLITEALRISTSTASTPERSLRQALLRCLEWEFPVDGPIQLPPGEQRLVAFIGPTGVGKTTTLAKLAAHFHLRQRRRVGLVTLDTYRVAAVEQLRIYAEILDVPLAVASTAAEVPAALLKMADRDLVLIDTAGRAPQDNLRMAELQGLLAAIRPAETHLVLSLAQGARGLMQAAEGFAAVPYTRLLLTKRDEAATWGGLLGVCRRTGKGIGYLSTGQNVPADLILADSRELARGILGEPQA